MKSRKGFSLIEVSCAVALIGITFVGIATGLGVASKSLIGMDIQETGKDLAAAQMEYIQSQPYDASHSPPVYQPLPSLSTRYPGFSVTIDASRIQKDADSDDDGIQLITLVVQQGARTAYTLTGEKVQW